VFVNLLRNALESRCSGVTVDVETEALDGAVRISVSDDGEGVAGEAAASVFEPFYSTKQASGGTGLGLAICRRIVADHGGEIRLESRAVAGTRFVVELPVPRASAWRTS
jgi:signal transduction histidine kinase